MYAKFEHLYSSKATHKDNFRTQYIQTHLKQYATNHFTDGGRWGTKNSNLAAYGFKLESYCVTLKPKANQKHY